MITVVKGDTAGLTVDTIITITPALIEASLTSGGDRLKAGHAIHAAGTREEHTPIVAGLRLATRKALQQAEEQGLHSIALARGISSGELAPETAAKVMVSEARCFLAGSKSIDDVIFSITDDEVFEIFSKVASRDQVVCLGDSITFGYPYGPGTSWVALASKMAGFRLVNEGINGDPTSGMLYRLKYYIIPTAPAYVIILGGANDILLDGSLEEVQDNLQTMAAIALAAGICPVLGIPAPALPSGGFVPPVLAGRLAEAMETIGRWVRVYADQEQLPVLDFYTPMLDPQTLKVNPHYFIDGAHPNQKGYRELAGAAAQLLLSLKKGFYK
jgi:lysophospholipase L1-like esterase